MGKNTESPDGMNLDSNLSLFWSLNNLNSDIRQGPRHLIAEMIFYFFLIIRNDILCYKKKMIFYFNIVLHVLSFCGIIFIC